ncbi:MAG: DUF3179 domain-containing (seleno)protein [Myxococcota bacterium]|nr:DUF3179 domain-containing (seleno)protein [Myxococcota bacterium]
MSRRSRIPDALRLALAGALLLAAASFASAEEAREEWNGFSLEGLSVSKEHLIGGGPPRDGIRSVDAPEFVAVADADWVMEKNPVLGVALGGVARVYPLHLMERHQIVNDRFGDLPVAVTYDPLAGAPRAFSRELDGRTLEFGVAGLIWNHGFLMYDRETESLWSQFTGECVAGKLVGKQLAPIRIDQVTLESWLAVNPVSAVLARPAPDKIDYRHSAFDTYIVRDETIFPVRAVDRAYHLKEVVVGVQAGGKSRAYLGSALTIAGGSVVDDFEGREIRIFYDGQAGLFAHHAPSDVKVQEAYWLAWKAFHPDTEVYLPEGVPEPVSPE